MMDVRMDRRTTRVQFSPCPFSKLGYKNSFVMCRVKFKLIVFEMFHIHVFAEYFF